MTTVASSWLYGAVICGVSGARPNPVALLAP
jgi:hypothetical protein